MALFGIAGAQSQAAEPVEVEHGKVAVVYFSWSPDGNTRFAAQTIAKKAGADIFEIKENHVRSLLSRTRHRLRKYIKEHSK